MTDAAGSGLFGSAGVCNRSCCLTLSKKAPVIRGFFCLRGRHQVPSKCGLLFPCTDSGDVVMRYLVLSLMLWSVNTASAEATPDCSEIRDPEERLRCFDERFPTAKPIESVPIEPKIAAPVAPEPVAPPVGKKKDPFEVEAQSERSSPVSAAPQAEEDDDEADSFGRRLAGLFSKPTTLDLQSRVKTVQQRDKQEMVFLLENDQIWMQVSPRNLPIRAGDSVTIKSTRFGGYMMATENGTSTRVKRID